MKYIIYIDMNQKKKIFNVKYYFFIKSLIFKSISKIYCTCINLDVVSSVERFGKLHCKVFLYKSLCLLYINQQKIQ